MTGTIKIEDLQLQCNIGTSEEERANSQKILVSLEMGIDMERAIYSQELASTVDYTKVIALLKELSQNKQWVLLERLAYDICQTLFSYFSLIKKINIEVKKTSLLDTRYVSIQICMER